MHAKTILRALILFAVAIAAVEFTSSTADAQLFRRLRCRHRRHRVTCQQPSTRPTYTHCRTRLIEEITDDNGKCVMRVFEAEDCQLMPPQYVVVEGSCYDNWSSAGCSLPSPYHCFNANGISARSMYYPVEISGPEGGRTLLANPSVYSNAAIGNANLKLSANFHYVSFEDANAVTHYAAVGVVTLQDGTHLPVAIEVPQSEAQNPIAGDPSPTNVPGDRGWTVEYTYNGDTYICYVYLL